MIEYKFNFDKYLEDLFAIEHHSKKSFIASKDSKVCWRSWGEGTPLILLHGGYGSWGHWIKQAIPFQRNIEY